jgi:hypothetical protein
VADRWRYEGAVAGGAQAWLGVAFAEVNIRYPVALAPGEAGLLVFRIKCGRSRSEERAVNTIPERVDADYSIGVSIDLAGDDGDDTALRADMELGRLRAEGIPRHVGWISN